MKYKTLKETIQDITEAKATPTRKKSMPKVNANKKNH